MDPGESPCNKGVSRDVKQKILQCVNSSASSEKRFEEEQEENMNDEIMNSDRENNNSNQADSGDETENFESNVNESTIIATDFSEETINSDESDCNESDICDNISVTKEAEEDFPSRNAILTYINSEKLYEYEDHRVKILKMITKYIRDIKKQKILDILDNHAFDDEDSVEDAVFLMSEVLYSK